MTAKLSPSQSAALLDILSHYDTYAEIRDFRNPGSLKHYGPPFTTEPTEASTAPVLQTLVTRFLLTLPGLNNLHNDFWKVQCHDIIENFEASNLSESYDKGVIGIRKTLATAISALIEYPLRGTFGGFAEIDTSHRQYDPTKANDLVLAFRDFMNECIYGTVLEDLVEKAGQTDKLEDHDALTKAVHEFVLVNLASFMHYTLVLSPKGQYLLKLIDNANKLIPYMMVKQTLKVGNVATMINAMMRIVLAKMSVTSVTNWFGITANQNDGQNLLQYIISTVLNWDVKDLELRASKLERERAKLGKDQLKVLKDYAARPREEQERIRRHSQKESISIVSAILQETDLEWNFTDTHHAHALEYVSIALSIRDRKEIINVLCHSSPDYLTQSIRQLVDAYEPVIRHLHNAVNLSGTIGDFEYFIRDMIKLAKITTDKYGKSTVPTVGDFIMLLRKHQYSSHTFIHQCAKNGPEVTSWYLAWAKSAASQFQQKSQSQTNPNEGEGPAAGDLTSPLQTLFSSLPSPTQESILPVLDAQTQFIDAMHAASHARLANVLTSPPSKNPLISKIFSSASRPSSRAASPAPGQKAPAGPPPDSKDQDENGGGDTPPPTPRVTADPGPGAYLARWQDLLDKTPITPQHQTGSVRAASSKDVVRESAVDVDGGRMVEFGEEVARGENIRVDLDLEEGKENVMKGGKPDVRVVVEALGEGFRRMLAERSMDW